MAPIKLKVVGGSFVIRDSLFGGDRVIEGTDSDGRPFRLYLAAEHWLALESVFNALYSSDKDRFIAQEIGLA